MSTRKLLQLTSLLSLLLIAYISADGALGSVKKNKEEQSRLELKVRNLPDSLFTPVQQEDLLNDEVYLKLAHEGWTKDEIVTIMGTAIADKKAAKQKIGYGHYAKQWLPTYGRQPGGDTLYMFIDTLYNEKMRKSVTRKVPEDLLNAYWPPIKYIPPKQRSGSGQENERIGGYFRCPQFKPFCGRMHWLVANPDNPDQIYAVPDGAGMYKTDNCGEHWECITDRIPERAGRSQCRGYAIPVDPDDWNHVFAFMNNEAVYETFDGGQSWRRIEGATNKHFKRGDCFRDKDGNLKFIGCTNTGWNSKLWISEDMCKTWTEVIVPDELKDIDPTTGKRGLWFQYITFDPSDRNKIYLPTSRSIFYFDDGAKSTVVNGKKTYNIKKLSFEVYDQEHNARRYPTGIQEDKGADMNNTTIFPCPATHVGHLVINPLNPNQWWFATGSYLRSNIPNSALYRTDDGGKTWTTLQDLIYGIGSGNVYGNELAKNWLGGFGVNFADSDKLYGCSMSSAFSVDGGKTFTQFPWGRAIKAKHDDGQYYYVAASRHNADNHFIFSHKSGRIFRGSDGGMLMLDPNINNGDWVSIGGDMGQMLFYHIAVNEFGDQVMAGNTQDIDGQTYRYGRWTKWRGYEGSESFINPYTSAVYFPNTGYQGLDPTMITINSWENGTTRADVVTGSWYIMRSGSGSNGRNLLRCDDMGQKLVNLQPAVGAPIGGIFGKFGLCRDKGRSTIYVITNSHVFKRSIDGGNTFETLKTPSGADVKFTNSVLATDPNNSDILYIGLRGKVVRYDINAGTWEKLGGESLPDIPCSNLMFHEGSGDLYFFHAGSAGIYILEYDKTTGQYAPAWRYWTKGYNASKATNVEINYTTQEMVLCDYGHSVWVADLEHPSDRYFENGFRLKERSFKDGRRTIGIDTEWTIPLYYTYKWTVNGEMIDNPYQYLHRKLNAGDRVQLELTLRESPDVHTLSAEYIVPAVGDQNNNEVVNPAHTLAVTGGDTANTTTGPVSYETPLTKIPGRALYSNGKGRIDLGYVDYFYKDFTIDFWLKPNGNGTILANTTRHSDAKGFELSVDGETLKFQYYPLHQVRRPPYEAETPQNAIVKGGSLKLGQWNHVAVTQQREGDIILYVNGEHVASAARINPEGSLNNVPVLSLFADAIEMYPIDAAVDELKIWNRSLTTDEVRREMYSTNAANEDGLVAYYPFNSGSLDSEREVFSARKVNSRVLAEVQYPAMSVPICAKHAIYNEILSGKEHTFKSADRNIIKISVVSDDENAFPASLAGNIGAYAFDASQWQNAEDNLNTDYYDYYPLGYLIHPFSQTEVEGNFSLEIYPAEGAFDSTKEYRLYTAGINSDKQVWEQRGSVALDAETGSLLVSDIKFSEIADKKLLIVTTKPSIELHVEGMGADGILPIYDESRTVYRLSANILSGLEEPEDFYQIDPDGIVKASGLYFAKGKASGELRLDLSKLGPFNSTTRATLRSSDNPVILDDQGNTRPSLIPLAIDVRNRIMPRQLGTALKIVNGRADIGNAADASKINGSRNATIMGWIRLDSVKNINAVGFNLFVLQHTGNKASDVTGLRVNRGKLEYYQNHRQRNLNNDLRIEESDLGVWRHIAVVLDSVSGNTTLYLNGVPRSFKYSEPINPVVGFHIGKNTGYGAIANTDNFCGAADQVGVWKRALSQDEIIKYMYMTPSLDDPDMVYYLNMDYKDEDKTMRDCYSMAEIKTLTGTGLTGSASFDEPIAVPFDARAIVPATATDSPISLTFPNGMQRDAVIATFRGTPYCYLNHDYQNYSAMAQEFYGITYRDFKNLQPSENDMVTMKYKHSMITEGERIAVALRRTGTTEHLAGFIHATSVTPGEATFEVPATFLTQASEVMFFTYPEEGGDGGTASRPANIQLGFQRSVINKINTDGDIPTIMLTEDMDAIPLIADIFRMATNNNNPVKIIVNETTYASSTQEIIDFSKTENQFEIKIDMDKIDPFGLNPLTVNLEGAEANEIKLNFYLEPYVHLSLLNGEQGDVISPDGKSAENQESPGVRRARLRKISETSNTITTTTPTATLRLNAEKLQGYMPKGESVQLEVVSDLNYSLNIGNGTLFNNKNVNISNLNHHVSESGPLYEGWNLIGNPYLTNINLTKSQNVAFDPERVTKFIYQCDPVTGNYKVYNMTDYNSAQCIRPFQSYFVQTLAPNATLTITPIAMEEEPTKRTRSYNVVEKKQIVFELSDAGTVLDEVTYAYDYNSNHLFEVNEDAPKMWNLTSSSPELFAVTDDNIETAVNVTDMDDGTLGVKSPVRKGLTLSIKSLTGIDEDKIIITDNATAQEWKPATQGKSYEFTTEEGVNKNRFQVTLKDISTGLDKQNGFGYKIEVDNGSCTISGLQGNAVVDIFSVSGLNVMSMHTGEPTLTLTMEKGVYIVVIRENDKEYTSKIRI